MTPLAYPLSSRVGLRKLRFDTLGLSVNSGGRMKLRRRFDFQNIISKDSSFEYGERKNYVEFCKDSCNTTYAGRNVYVFSTAESRVQIDPIEYAKMV